MSELEGTQQRILELERDIANIRTQIEAAQATAAQTGEYADRSWFRRARTALRYKGVEHQRLLKQAAELRRAEKNKREVKFERAFIAAARRRLDPTLYQTLVDDANATVDDVMASEEAHK